MTLAEREELRRVGRENNATAGLVCPAHVKAAFNFEFDDIDIDVPLEELLVEASKETPRWRVILTPLPRAAVKCAIAGCHYQRKMTLAEREELRRVGRENNATAGLVCPAHVKAAFNFEFDDIDIDVPLEELLVEASKETPRWRVILTPLPRAADEPDSQSTPGSGDRVI